MSDTQSTNGDSEIPARVLPTAPDLLHRCETLLNELEAFKEHLKTLQHTQHVEIAHFRNTVKSEHRTLQRLSSREDADATQHTVNSSNLPFLETVWNAVKNTRGLQAMQKRFYWGDDGKGGRHKKNSVLVDVVTEDGKRWIKVSLLTNTRLLFDKAKQGWEDAGSSEDDEDDEEGDNDDSSNDVPLVRLTKDLVLAASHQKLRTKHPRITLILPKIHTGQIPAIDSILDSLRSLDVEVLTSSSPPIPTPLETVLPHLLTDPFACLTPTLNIDCTILLALVSDFSHSAVEAEPWFHRALKRQVEIEDEENLLPNLLYPALASKSLICTEEAAKRMQEIVDTIGTPSEKARTEIFMGSSTYTSPSDLRDQLATHSRFSVPDSLILPITTQPATISSPTLPASAEKVKERLTPINQSVFLHGWSKGFTTVTSNRTVVKLIDGVLEREAEDESDWPGIWLCPTARSLVGKEKGRRE